jgi:23S rRNA (uracil1939-C5)-methyltransferase
VVNPPRKGLSPEAFDALIGTGAARVIYISCEPTTLARDLDHFSHEGYEVKKVQPFDMFPQTDQVETVALLERKEELPAVFGKKVKEYVRFERWILILIVVVFALRLGLSLAGVSNKENGFGRLASGPEWVSINLVLLVGILYCAIAVQTTGFGTYKHLFPLLLIQTTIAHGLIGMGIILGIVTGHNNIFTAPEHCGVCGADGLRWGHALGHIVLEPPLVSLISWLPASAILFVTRKVGPRAFEGPLVVVLAIVMYVARKVDW